MPKTSAKGTSISYPQPHNLPSQNTSFGQYLESPSIDSLEIYAVCAAPSPRRTDKISLDSHQRCPCYERNKTAISNRPLRVAQLAKHLFRLVSRKSFQRFPSNSHRRCGAPAPAYRGSFVGIDPEMPMPSSRLASISYPNPIVGPS